MEILPVLLTFVASLGGWLTDERTQRLGPPVGLAVIAIFFMMRAMRRRQHQFQQPRREPVSPQRVPQQISADMRRDLDELLVELQELSRKISAEIDTKFAKLEAGIRDADRRIAVLHRLSRALERTGEGSAESKGGDDARYAVVYELADAGFSPVDIARELGKTPGEVELILNLRKKVTPRP